VARSTGTASYGEDGEGKKIVREDGGGVEQSHQAADLD
jgi:hypothetical protein